VRVVFELEDSEAGLMVSVKGFPAPNEEVGALGLVDTSLASITSANMLTHLATVIKTTGLRVKVAEPGWK
jgi:hypothetical protein